MSVPAYDASDPSAYVQGILDLVGAHDPRALLADAPARLAAATAGLSEDDARRPEPPARWSVLRILRHLADSEIVYGYRLRTIVAAGPDVLPPIAGYDQDAWADRLHYDAGSLRDALDDFAAMRRMTLRWLGTLSDEERARAGLHSERGEESVDRITRLLAGHDLNHERQILRVRDALGV